MHYSHDTHATHDTLSFIIITIKSSMSVKKYVLINDFFLIKPEVKLTSDFFKIVKYVLLINDFSLSMK